MTDSASSPRTRPLGGTRVFPVGMGAMTLTQVPGYDEARAVRTVHAALDAGVTLFDTADVYGPAAGYGVNESMLAKAVADYPGSVDHVVVATKGGHLRPGDQEWDTDGRPEHLRRACEDSLRRLGLEALPLYLHHRPDPKVPYAETMGGLRDLYEAGLIRRAGISNANPEQIRLAHGILGDALVAVENEYSPGFRSSEPEIALCEELGLAFLAWGPFGGMRQAKGLGARYAAFEDVARERGVSTYQVVLAWQLHRSQVVVPIPGASRPESVRDSAAAAGLALSGGELARLERDEP
ncbi:aldo/keto reductase [Streptomyces sp. NPDC096132]|uniref:aldo/keto reductase n=1 Tax=Streptomyces sp. NPDC096132 TaxID=3366075 RepID=UPI0037FEA3F9